MELIKCPSCPVLRPETMYQMFPKRKRKRWCNLCRAELKKKVASNRRALTDGGVYDTSGKSYTSRDQWLSLLGFKSYREYLQSDLWKSIRKRVYKLRGDACFLCGMKAQALPQERSSRKEAPLHFPGLQ